MRVEVRDPLSLTGEELGALYELFQTAFEAEREGFEHDLREKHKILTVKSEGSLDAFTSLRLYRPEPGVRVFFSGDTFVSPQARIGHRLPSLWARYVFAEVASENTGRDYWLLFCSGFRTYRILPTFFLDYVPTAGSDQANELLRLRDHWASELFGGRFSNGVVKPRWATPLHSPDPPKRLQDDATVKFFLESNPGYRDGDELVCLVPLEESNLTPAGLRLVSRGVAIS